MSARAVKRSVTLRGHRTSVSLEDAFWYSLRDIAGERAISISALAADIDAKRGPDTRLASAIRVFVLEYYKARAASAAGEGDGPAHPPV